MHTQTSITPATAAPIDAVGTGPGAQATTGTPIRESRVTITIEITPDQVVQVATEILGGFRRSHAKIYKRTSPGCWKTRDGDWSDQEELLGAEVADYMARLDLPSRIANMLPRLPAEPKNDGGSSHA